MTLCPLDTISDRELARVTTIATDMDGTLTTHSHFSSEVINALQELAKRQIEVLIVTGRAAGWVSALASLLPLKGAIGENGGVFYATPTNGEEVSPLFLGDERNVTSLRSQLAQTFQTIARQFCVSAAPDNAFRITDWTFDVHGLSPEALKQMEQICAADGFDFTYSAVQCHIMPRQQNKARGVKYLLEHGHLAARNTQEIITIGDSPNDESLFDPMHFPLSVGVANVVKYQSAMAHLPLFVTPSAQGQGFCELASRLLTVHNKKRSS